MSWALGALTLRGRRECTAAHYTKRDELCNGRIWMAQDLAVGIDVGGTKIAASLVSRDSDTIRLLRTFTPRDSGGAILAAIQELVEDLLSSPEAKGVSVRIGLGVPAQIDFERQRILFCTNLPLKGTDLAGGLASKFGLPVVMDNDANLAALAEARFGAASACTDVVCITLGTGIGGGLVLGGKLYRGWLGAGAEIGHMVIEHNGRPCGCGGRGCFETLAAGPALEANAREAIRERPNSLLAELAGADPDDVSGELVTEAAAKGDPVAIALLTHVGRVVGEAITSIANLLNPQIFVIGGGMVDAGDFIIEPARKIVEECAMEGVVAGLRIVPATLGNNAGYLGAAALAFEHFDEGGR